MTLKNITFLDQFIPNNMFCSNNATKERFYFNDSFEVRVFLNNLEDDTVYVVTFDFIVS
jgi:hypothetical protein